MLRSLRYGRSGIEVRTDGTFNNNNMSGGMEMSADEYVTQTNFHLEPMRCAHIVRDGIC